MAVVSELHILMRLVYMGSAEANKLNADLAKLSAAAAAGSDATTAADKKAAAAKLALIEVQRQEIAAKQAANQLDIVSAQGSVAASKAAATAQLDLNEARMQGIASQKATAEATIAANNAQIASIAEQRTALEAQLATFQDAGFAADALAVQEGLVAKQAEQLNLQQLELNRNISSLNVNIAKYEAQLKGTLGSVEVLTDAEMKQSLAKKQLAKDSLALAKANLEEAQANLADVRTLQAKNQAMVTPLGQQVRVNNLYTGTKGINSPDRGVQGAANAKIAESAAIAEAELEKLDAAEAALGAESVQTAAKLEILDAQLNRLAVDSRRQIEVENNGSAAANLALSSRVAAGERLAAQDAKLASTAEGLNGILQQHATLLETVASKSASLASASAQVIERLTKVALTLGGAVVVGLEAVGLEFDSVRQKADITFGAMLKDADAGKEFTNQLYDFTRTTALSFTTTATAATELKARGLAIGEIIPTLKVVSDAAAALPRPFDETVQRIIYDIGQIRETGTVNSRELRSLAMIGINAWQYVADAIGKTIPQTKKAVALNAVESKTAADAILAGIEKDFAGFAQIQKTTFAGTIASAKRDFSELAGVFAQPLFDILQKSFDKLGKTLENSNVRQELADIGKSVATLMVAWATGLTTLVIPSLEWIINHKAALVGVAIAVAASWVAVAGPISAIGILIGVIITSIGLIKSNNESLPGWLLDIKITLLGWVDAAVNAYNNIKKAVDEVKTIGNVALKLNITFLAPPGLGTLLGLNGTPKKVYDVIINLIPGGSGTLNKILGIGAGIAGIPTSPKQAVNAVVDAIPGVSLMRSAVGLASNSGVFSGPPSAASRDAVSTRNSQGFISNEAQTKAAFANFDNSISKTVAKVDTLSQSLLDDAAEVGKAQSALSAIISDTFKQPTVELVNATLAADQAQAAYTKQARAAQEHIDALDASTHAIQANQHALSQQKEALNEQSYGIGLKQYGISEQSYSIDQQIANIQRANRPAPANAVDAQIRALEDRKFALEQQNHSYEKQQHAIELQQHNLDVTNAKYTEQIQKIEDLKKVEQDTIDQQKLAAQKAKDVVADIEEAHNLMKAAVDAARGDLPTEAQLQDFVNNSLIPLVHETTSALVNAAGGYFQSILVKPLGELASASDNLKLSLGSLKLLIDSFTARKPDEVPAIPGRAAGGQIQAGQAYLVGEKGMEIFKATQNGYIVPNHQIGGVTGSATNLNGVANLLDAKYPHTDFSFDNSMQLDQAKTIGNELDTLLVKYKFMQGFIDSVKSQTGSGNDYANTMWGSDGHSKITINSAMLGNKSIINGLYKNDVKSGFHPDTGTLDATSSVIAHEFGHAVEATLRHLKKLGSGWVKAVSKYATVNQNEAFAEAFAGAQGGGKVDTSFAQLLSHLPLMDNGGPIYAGQRYLVGGRGPELAIMGGSTGRHVGSGNSTHNDTKHIINLAPITINNNGSPQGEQPDLFRRLVGTG